jgi:hypothetical protein
LNEVLEELIGIIKWFNRYHKLFNLRWLDSFRIHQYLDESTENICVQILILDLIIFEVEPELRKKLFNVKSILSLSEVLIGFENDFTHLLERKLLLMSGVILRTDGLKGFLNLMVKFLF